MQERHNSIANVVVFSENRLIKYWKYKIVQLNFCSVLIIFAQNSHSFCDHFFYWMSCLSSIMTSNRYIFLFSLYILVINLSKRRICHVRVISNLGQFQGVCYLGSWCWQHTQLHTGRKLGTAKKIITSMIHAIDALKIYLSNIPSTIEVINNKSSYW